ncbi:MAG: hypothetical protein JJE17_11360 [Peptostreptococcaceae bacterium]|nr:hypothetical protein [Peptostreptococcaceae bacterium]
MEKIKLKLNATSVILLVAASIFILLYLIQVSGGFPEEWQLRVEIAAGGIMFVAFLCEIFIDIIKQKYNTMKYIVLAEIIGIIAWSVLCYTSIIMGSMPIYSYDFISFGYYKVAAIILNMAMIYTRGFLKSKRFEKTRK